MKSLLNKSYFPILAGVVSALFIFASGQITLTGLGKAVSKNSKTYAASQTDTVIYNREVGDVNLSFAVHTKDSSNFTNAVLRRVIDGVAAPAVAGDTLFSSDSSASARSIVKTITLAPLADQYWIIVKYTANNGAIDQGTTTPTVVYEVNKGQGK